MLNAVIKGKYGRPLQDYPRLTALIKSFDTDVKQKAAVFTTVDIEQFLLKELTTPYWMLRKAVIVFAFCGGLRLQELMDLKVITIVSIFTL